MASQEKKRKKPLRNWKSTQNGGIMREIIETLNFFQTELNITPPLRSIYYNLSDRKIIGATKSDYSQLSNNIVWAKKNKLIPWGATSDESRPILNYVRTIYQTPENYVQIGIDYLKAAAKDYKMIRWVKQQHYVELWQEKRTLLPTFNKILEGKDIVVATTGGWESWEPLRKAANRLKDQIALGKKIYILYFGDFDPSGLGMDVFLLEGLFYFGLNGFERFYKLLLKSNQLQQKSNPYIREMADKYAKLLRQPEKSREHPNETLIEIHFQRMAVTSNQITQYELPTSFDALSEKSRQKLINDTRSDNFRKKYGGLYQAELDGFLGRHAKQFKSIVLNSVDRYFDQNIYQAMLALPEHRPDEISRLVNSKVKFLD